MCVCLRNFYFLSPRDEENYHGGGGGATARERRETNLTSRREADKEIKG